MKKFEYKEPEFTVVQANAEDILTLSNSNSNWVVGKDGLSATNGAPDFVPIS